MKCESIQQFAIVRTDSASAFEDTLNARIMELAKKHPVVAFHETDPLFARISYTESVSVPESLSDEYELAGVRFTCKDCPMFAPILKEDGTEDSRYSYGDCEFAAMGRTYKDSRACDQLFVMLRNGRIGLCWKK